MDHDQVLAVHARVFMKMTYKDPAVPNISYPSLTPPCEELWLPQPRPDEVDQSSGRAAPTNRAATLRVLNDYVTSSLWDEKTVEFPQSGWVFINFPFDAHVATLRFKVTDATVHQCNDDDFRAHTIREMAKVHGDDEGAYLRALAPNGWTVGSLRQWRAFTAKATSMYGSEYDKEYCTIQIPLTRNPTPYLLNYYIFDALFMLIGVTTTNFYRPPQMTSRYSITVFSMLLLMTTLRRDLGYGVVEYVTIINLQAFLSMVVLTLCIFLTIIVHYLGETQLGAIVNRVGRQTAITAGVACAIGFFIQLVVLQPAPSSVSSLSGSTVPPVFSELQIDATASHLWPWLVSLLLWLAVNAVRIEREYRARVRLVRKTVIKLQEINPSADADKFEQDSAHAFQLLDVGQNGVVLTQELRPFLERIDEAEGKLHESAFAELFRQSRRFTGLFTRTKTSSSLGNSAPGVNRILIENPQGIKLADFQQLVKTRIAGTKTTTLGRTRRSERMSKIKDAADTRRSERMSTIKDAAESMSDTARFSEV